MAGWLDPTDGVFVNVNGATGEMITDPNTGELKIVAGSNQPIGGGAGGTTAAGPAGGPGAGIFTTSLINTLQQYPWAIPAFILLGIALLAGVLDRRN